MLLIWKSQECFFKFKNETEQMGELLQLALQVKEYVEENGRTLSISQGKMLKDHELAFEQYLNKQTA